MSLVKKFFDYLPIIILPVFTFFKKTMEKKLLNKKNLLFKESWKNNLFNNEKLDRSFKEMFVNFLMIHGKKSKAKKILSQSAFSIRKKLLIDKKTKQKLTLLINNNRKSLVKKNLLTKNFIENNLLFTNNITLIDNKEINFSAVNYFIKFSVTKNVLKKMNILKKRKKQNKKIFIQETNSNFSLEKFLKKTVNNIKPIVEVRKVRKAGTTYQVPAIISKKRQETLAIRWIINAARKRKEKSNLSFSECLSQELVEAFNKQGQARQRRDELHKIAEANRAFIRYRWW